MTMGGWSLKLLADITELTRENLSHTSTISCDGAAPSDSWDDDVTADLPASETMEHIVTFRLR